MEEESTSSIRAVNPARTSHSSFGARQSGYPLEVEEEEEEIHHLASPKGSAELSIVELQRADGSWELNPELALALSCKSPAIQAAKPKDANEPQWATLLVLVWLHSQATDSQDEWGLLAKKAYIWLKKQGANIVNWVAEANKLLNTSVDQKDLQ
uniref:von Willebrand factor A domain-containing protein 5A-like isoform X2 n=1 Tax=Myxine glutinosa TaxID=7769 RepID=UPI00358EED01